MVHRNTIFSQILKLVPRHEFETLAKQDHSGRAFRTASRWSQFVAMTMAQLSARNSLRDTVANLSVRAHRRYHLGSAKLFKSNLSRINEDKPYAPDVALFGKLLKRCQGIAPSHNFRFTNTLYSLDVSTIDADFSKASWQVELFFKWNKQNLQSKSFVGTSKNAVMTQVWIAMSVYLLLAFLKFQAQVTTSLQQILRLFQLNLFEKVLCGHCWVGNHPIMIYS